MTQVASAVSTAHPSASQPGPINPMRRDMRHGARGNGTPLHGSSINSGRRHVMCKATVARPHSKNSTRAANVPCTVQYVLMSELTLRCSRILTARSNEAIHPHYNICQDPCFSAGFFCKRKAQMANCNIKTGSKQTFHS